MDRTAIIIFTVESNSKGVLCPGGQPVHMEHEVRGLVEALVEQNGGCSGEKGQVNLLFVNNYFVVEGICNQREG